MNSFEQAIETTFILKNKPLPYDQLSRVPLLTFTLVSKYPKLPWDWSIRALGGRKEIDDALYAQYKNRFPIETLLCANQMTPETVLRYLNNDWTKMSKKEGLSSDFIHRNIDKDWNWRSVCEHAALTLDFMEQHPRIYYWGELSCNPHVSRQLFLAYPQRVNWSIASSNPVCSTRFILQHEYDYPWHWGYYGVMDNPTLSIICVNDIIHRGHYIPSMVFTPDKTDLFDLSMYRTMDRTRILKRELIERCWHTGRVMDWCMSMDELNELKNDCI